MGYKLDARWDESLTLDNFIPPPSYASPKQVQRTNAMTILKYRGASGVQTLIDITATLNDISNLKTRTSSLEGKVSVLDVATGWTRLSYNCFYKKIGKICFVQCDYMTLEARIWKTIGTLPAGYRPIATGLSDDVDKVMNAAVHRGDNNVGIIQVSSDGKVEMFSTVASNYWAASISFPCA